MHTNPQISVIVPVHNTEKYLSECINSILKQSYEEYEIILVDDGSIDQSGKICDKFKSENNCIEVIHQINQGVTKARANGVQIAKGEWICFVDSDDTLPINSLKVLYEMSHENTDIIIGFANKEKNIFRQIDIATYREFCIRGNVLPTEIWGKLFRKKIFNSHIFDIPQQIIWGEDMLMNIRLSFATKKNIQLIPQHIYNYRKHEGSCTARFHMTLDYEYKYHLERLRSIPKNEILNYMPACIRRRIWAIRVILYTNYQRKWRDSKFASELMADIKKVNFHLSLKEYILFNINSDIPFLLWKNILSLESFFRAFIK